jgi:calcineurin-like phosphoesterase family protein
VNLNREGWVMFMRQNWISVYATAVCVSATGCGGGTEPSPPPPPLPAEVILAAGNIAKCTATGDEATAALLDTLPGTIFVLGDNAFPNGSIEAYTNCYEPSWGRHKARTYAALGNHEYNTGAATASFDYFGDRAGPRDLGYYSFDLGNWHIIVLNINDHTVDSLVPFSGTAQDVWLQSDLASNRKLCTLAMWHSTRFFSSNSPGWTSNAYVKPVWDRLYAAGVDVVLNGHQHQYERFPPMRPSGARDDVRGIRQFNAGTGGESTEMPIVLAPDREALTDAFGVLRLTLDAGSYSWEFVPAIAGQFSDNGSGTCH